MGLDIYKLELITKDEIKKTTKKNREKYFGFPTYQYEDNKSASRFFEQFKDYLVEEKAEFYNFEKWFLDKNLDIKNYGLTSSSYGKEIIYSFVNLENKEEIIELNAKEVETYKKTIHKIYAQEIGYQRKSVKYDFYKKFYGNCWYVNGEDTEIKEEDEMFFVLNNEELNKMKEHVEQEAPSMSWVLEKNQFVYISA